MKRDNTKEWYKACEFIIKEMQFYSVKDFWKQASDIKFYYEHSNYHVRQLYQWYVFANQNVSNQNKELIWDYLNGYITL